MEVTIQSDETFNKCCDKYLLSVASTGHECLKQSSPSPCPQGASYQLLLWPLPSTSYQMLLLTSLFLLLISISRAQNLGVCLLPFHNISSAGPSLPSAQSLLYSQCFHLAGILASAARLIFIKSNSNHITLQLKNHWRFPIALGMKYHFLVLSCKAQPHPTAPFYKLSKVSHQHFLGAQYVFVECTD